MANVIIADDVNMLNTVSKMLVNAMPDQRAMDYFQRNYQQFIQTVQQYGQDFAARVTQTFQTVTNNTIIDKAKELIARHSAAVFNDRIYAVNYDNIYNSGWMMRQYILADPALFNMYMNNRLQGWDDEVHLPEKDVPAEWRDDYLHVIDGFLRFDEEGNGVITHCSLESPNPFTLSERMIIQDAWDIAEDLIAEGKDPTDPHKGNI